MALPLLATLDTFVSTGGSPACPPTLMSLYAPVDDVRGALLALVESAERSLHVSMYALTDLQMVQALIARDRAGVALQVTLDYSQSVGPTEAALLRDYPFPSDTVAIGRSEHDSIIHMKCMVIDALDVVSGSTNWSHSGEALEDNDLLVVRNPALAARYIERLTALHRYVLAHPPRIAAGSVPLDAEVETPQERCEHDEC